MQLSTTIKDRNGEDVVEGDYVFFLRGSLAGGDSYETGSTVMKMDTRARRVLVDSGDTLYWHEFWKNPER